MKFENKMMKVIVRILELTKTLTNIKPYYENKNFNWLKYIFQILAK